MKRISLLILCVFLCSCAMVSDSRQHYCQATSYAKAKNYDAAFMSLKTLLNSDQHSPYAPKAAFAVGEYYYESNDYLDAIIAFRKYITAYPEDEGVVFAELIIYRMATQLNPNKNIPFNERYFLSSIRKKMFDRPVFFIFTENKESFSYSSAFGNVYLAFDYVDKIQITRNGDVLFELSP